MERAERFIAISVGLIFPGLLIPVLWVMLVLTLVTAGQRFTKIWKQATNDMPTPTPPQPGATTRPRATGDRRSKRMSNRR